MGAHQPITEEELLALLKQASQDLELKAWVVGGYVRDKLLGLPHSNPDVVVEGGDALKLAERFAELAHAARHVRAIRHGPGHAARALRRVRHRPRRVLRAGIEETRCTPGHP
jgi:tRNA nucleotidyltransferase/poly(A) polymerase